MSAPKIPLARPILGDAEVQAVERVLRSGQLTGGPEVKALEDAIAARAKRRHCVALSSATAALELALWAKGVGPGDDVLVPAFAFPAAAGATRRVGARPVPVDVDKDTWNLDVDNASRALTPKTRAVISIDQFGVPAHAEPLLRFAQSARIPLISDAACSLGAVEQSGRPAGSYGDVAVFSFHPRKIVTCGEGGALVTDDDALYASICALRNQGQSGPGQFTRPGTNARLSAVNASILRPQLARLETICAARERLARTYADRLALLINSGKIELQFVPAGARSVFQTFALRLAPEINRARVIATLADGGIESNVATYACSKIPALCEPADTPVALALHERGLALPLFPTMEIAEVDRVVSCLEGAIA
jgi:dTDP-4-amino-4,6-dideoxygalactose transaminase